MTAVHRPFFYIDPEESRGETFRIRGSDARHLARVRRASKGDLIWVSDGRGGVWEAEITTVSPAEIEVVPQGFEFHPPAMPLVTMLVGLAKGGATDDSIRGLVELGVEEIIIFTSSRSLPPGSSSARERRDAIALEAAKQSHRPRLATLIGPLTLDEAIAEAPRPLFVADPRATRLLREVLPADSSSALSVLVGPEGGLTTSETESLTEGAGVPFTLGSQILRTETATLAIAALFMYHCRRLG